MGGGECHGLRVGARNHDKLVRSIVFEGGHLAQPNWPNQTGPVIGEIKSPSQEPDRNGKCSRRYNYGILEFYLYIAGYVSLEF